MLASRSDKPAPAVRQCQDVGDTAASEAGTAPRPDVFGAYRVEYGDRGQNEGRGDGDHQRRQGQGPARADARHPPAKTATPERGDLGPSRHRCGWVEAMRTVRAVAG